MPVTSFLERELLASFIVDSLSCAIKEDKISVGSAENEEYRSWNRVIQLIKQYYSLLLSLIRKKSGEHLWYPSQALNAVLLDSCFCAACMSTN